MGGQYKEEWAHYRNAAQLLLGSYGRSILDSIPEALCFMLEAYIAASPDTGTGIKPNIGHEAYLLACRLHDVCAGIVDDMGETPVSDAFPMGVDIVYMRRALRSAAVVETSTDMYVQACALTDAVWQRYKTDDGAAAAASGEGSAAFVNPGRLGCAQIAFAYVFSAPVPTARVAQDLLIMRNESDCLKTLNEAALRRPPNPDSVHYKVVHFSAGSETPELSLAEFKRRVTKLNKCMPQVLVSAMHSLRLMGPSFFNPTTTRPYVLEHPLPYDYAMHLEQRFTCKSRDPKK